MTSSLAAGLGLRGVRARPIPPRVASVAVTARGGGETTATRTQRRATHRGRDVADADRAPTAAARLAASLGASTSTHRSDLARANTKAARKERRDAKHARDVGPHHGSANSPDQVDASLSREMAAMAGGIDALAQRALDIALADERNLEVALHLASAASAAADEELQLASVAAETGNLDWPEDASTDTGAGSFFIVDGASTKEDDIVAAHRERAQLCARSANTIASNLSERLLIDEWSATIAHFAASDWLVDRKKPRVRPKDRRCNQPKARQGWTKRAMRETRVRVCAGCDRMLPTTELIRVARLQRPDDEAEAASKQSPCEPGEQQKQQNKKEKEKENDNKKKNRWTIALDAGSVADSVELLQSLAAGGSSSLAVDSHPSARAAADGLLRKATTRAAASAGDDDAARMKRKSNALQGRAAYVCRRGVCARAVTHPKTRRLHRILGAGGAFNDAFVEAFVDVCVAAEREDGVDSTHWRIEGHNARPGLAQRLAGHPRYLDSRTGETADGSDMSGLVWAAERSDFGTEGGGGGLADVEEV